MANRNLQAVVYTDDAGNDWATKIDAAIFAQVDGNSDPIVGGADYTGTPALPALPANIRPRTAKVSAAGNKRRVVCLTPTAPLYTGDVTTVNLQVLGAAAVAYTRYGRSGEKAGVEHDPTG